MAFSRKDWKDNPDPSTPLSAAAMEDLEDRLYAARLDDLPLNVKHSTYGAVGNGVADDTAAINDALGDVNPGEKGIVYLPPGTYKITDPLVVKEGVALKGAGSYATVVQCASSDAKVYFDQTVGGGRGPLSGGFRVNMAETATTGMQLDSCVNRSFEDLRIDSMATNGTGLLLRDCQNCDFDGVDIEAKGGGGGPSGTRGLVFDLGSSGNNFYGIRTNECTDAHISYRQTGTSLMSGVDYPRHNWLWGVMIERGIPGTTLLVKHLAGADNGICGGNLALGPGASSPGAEFPMTLFNTADEAGAPHATTSSRFRFRDITFSGEVWGGNRYATAIKALGDFHYGEISSCSVGNVKYLLRTDTWSAQWRDHHNFVDTLATARYVGADAYQRANYESVVPGTTLDPRRGQVSYLYIGGTGNLTRIEPHVETGFVVTLHFYVNTRTIKNGTDNIYTASGSDITPAAQSVYQFIHDGAGAWRQV